MPLACNPIHGPSPIDHSPLSRDDSSVVGNPSRNSNAHGKFTARNRSKSQEPPPSCSQVRSPEKMQQDREFYRNKLPTVLQEFTVIEERLSDAEEQFKTESPGNFAAQAFRSLLEVLENEVKEHLVRCPRCRSQSYFGSLRPNATNPHHQRLPVKHLASMCQIGQRGLARVLGEILFETISEAITEMRTLVEESYMEAADKDEVQKFIDMYSSPIAATFKGVREVRQYLGELQKEHELRKYVVFEIKNFGALKADVEAIEHNLTSGNTIQHIHTSVIPSNLVKTKINSSLKRMAHELYKLVSEWEQEHNKALILDGERYLDQYAAPPTTPSPAASPTFHHRDACGIAALSKQAVPLNSTEWDTALPEPDQPIQVLVRVRPLLQFELAKAQESCVSVMSDNKTILFQPPEIGGKPPKSQQMEFSVCFDDTMSQKDVFSQSGVMKLLNYGLNGTNVTVFAYGQTGSGKTFTLSGQQEWMGVQEVDEMCTFGMETPLPDIVVDSVAEVRQQLCAGQGLIPRAVKFLYARIKCITTRNPSIAISITASCFEVYNEQVQDLLVPEHNNLAVRQDSTGFKVEGLLKKACPSVDDLLEIIMESVKNRKTSPHAMNKDSSRSHAIICLDVTRTNNSSGVMQTSNNSIMFVDLAGSEQAKKTKQFQSSLIETSNINKSLFALSNCISTLSAKATTPTATASADNQFVQFRDSKLTKILMNSLSGHGLVLLIATVSPSRLYCEETANTLFFAAKAANIIKKTMPQLSSHEKEVLSVQSELKQTKQQFNQLQAYCQYLTQLLIQNNVSFQPHPFVECDEMLCEPGSE